MTTQTWGGVLSAEQKNQFETEGYLVVEGLFREEADLIRDTFMKLHAGGPIPRCFAPVSAEESGGDVLRQYPRMLHPHRVNQLAMDYMLHPKVMHILADLFGEEPLAAQSMFYFKPPGAKGQAIHQDNLYLKVEPGTCIAAWTAVDRADEENGGLVVVPRTHNSDLQCPHRANPEESFTNTEVDVPEGCEVTPVVLEAGDVLFFNGSVIHGSYPNRSADRFRRSFICHYTGISTTKIAGFYKPLYKADGTEAEGIDVNLDSGPCGEEFKITAAH